MSLSPTIRLLRPPLLRPRRYFPPAPARRFHASSQCRTFLDTTTTLLTDLHSNTGLSWSLIIPLTAISLRLFVVLPFMLYARSKTETIIRLLPLQSARQHHHARMLQQHLVPEAWESALKVAVARDREDLWRRWGCQRWKLYLPLAQMPVWIAASATIRALMPGGSGGGLVGFLGGVAERVTAAGLAGEGMPWCLDLTGVDATLALPTLFAAAALANVRWQAHIDPPVSRGQKIWVKALSVVSVACFVISAGQPAGVVLYWATSAGCGLGVNVVLHKLWPLPKRVDACKRAMTRVGEERVKEDGGRWFQWGGMGATTVPGGGGRIDK